MCIFVVLLSKVVQGNEQVCEEFEDDQFFLNGLSEPRGTYYTCKLKAELKDETGNTKIDTKANEKSNFDVTAVHLFGYQSGLIIKFIPFSIFKTFPLLEYLIMTGEQEFEHLKPGYFTGAENLKVLVIKETAVKELTESLFAEAPNLNFINLQENQIHTVDQFAFIDVPMLRGLYLDKNAITNLHPETFSYLADLEVLSLLENKCIDKQFVISNGDFSEVEEEIRANCEFNEVDVDGETKTNKESSELISPVLNNTKTEPRKENFAQSNEKIEEVLSKLLTIEKNYKELTKKFTDLAERFEVSEKAHQSDALNTSKNNSDNVIEMNAKIESLTVEIEFLKEDCSKCANNELEESLNKTFKSLKESDSNLLLKIEESFNSTQEQINKLNFGSAPVEENTECCNKASAAIIETNTQHKKFQKDTSATFKMLGVRVIQSEKDIKLLKSEDVEMNKRIAKLEDK